MSTATPPCACARASRKAAFMRCSASSGRSGEFVAALEDVLALYALPYDAGYPTGCLDEKQVVLHADVRPGLPPAPGHVECRDYEYERDGTANLFVMVEPLAGWRPVS